MKSLLYKSSITISYFSKDDLQKTREIVKSIKIRKWFHVFDESDDEQKTRKIVAYKYMNLLKDSKTISYFFCKNKGTYSQPYVSRK